jgi:ribosomal protein S18 acetylase RimI-like enzyme
VIEVVKIRNMKPNEVENISSFRRTHLGDFIENKFKNYIRKNPDTVIVASSDDDKFLLGYAFAYLWRSDTGIIHHVLCSPEVKSPVEKELLTHIDNRFSKRRLNKAYAWAKEDQEDLIKNLYSMNYTLDCEMLVFENNDITSDPNELEGNQKITISDFKENNIHDVMDIEKKCFKPSWHQNRDDFLKYSKRQNCQFSVAKDNEKAVAYLQVAASGKLGYLGRVAVHPNYQRRGIATRLMKEAMNWFSDNNATMVKLRSPQSDIPAHILYKNFGFSQIGKEYEFLKQF